MIYEIIRNFNWLNKSGWNWAMLITWLRIYWASTPQPHYHDLRTSRACSWIFQLKYQKSSQPGLTDFSEKKLWFSIIFWWYFYPPSVSQEKWQTLDKLHQNKYLTTQLTQCFHKRPKRFLKRVLRDLVIELNILYITILVKRISAGKVTSWWRDLLLKRSPSEEGICW